MKVAGLLALCLLFVYAIHVACQNQYSPEQNAKQTAQQSQVTLPPQTSDQQATKGQQNPSGYFPGWRRLLTWPDGITAFAVILTLLGIVWQSSETRKAAQAALIQSRYTVASQRAWVLPEKIELVSGSEDRPEGKYQVFVQCAAKNHGPTVARVLGMNAVFALGPISKPEQTWQQSLYDFDSRTKPQSVILPDKITALHSLVPEIKAMPGDVIPGTSDPNQTTFIHGVICYWDAFNEIRRFTRFCYRSKNGVYSCIGGER